MSINKRKDKTMKNKGGRPRALTNEEIETARLLKGRYGKSRDEIANQFGVSEATIKRATKGVRKPTKEEITDRQLELSDFLSKVMGMKLTEEKLMELERMANDLKMDIFTLDAIDKVRRYLEAQDKRNVMVRWKQTARDSDLYYTRDYKEHKAGDPKTKYREYLEWEENTKLKEFYENWTLRFRMLLAINEAKKR